VLLSTRTAAARAATAWQDRVDVVPATADDRLPAGVASLLVRPDGYVAWVDDGSADDDAAAGFDTAAREWFGAPLTSTSNDTSKDDQRRGGTVTDKMMTRNELNPNAKVHECDVVILGSGLAGSVAGAILARQGAKVALIDAATHPRFAVGESMTPQLVEWLHILAARFDVPEIAHLLDVKSSTEHISASHGRKQHFGFIRHEPNKEPDPREANMFVIPSILTESSHLFRQDTDSYFFHVAARYGCLTRQAWRAVDLDIDEDGVTVTGHTGETFHGKYLIDASGFRSPLAEKFDLREKPARFKHHARSLFTHYIGIKPFDEVSHHPASLRPPALWHGGTLHHLIERGWFWIIPFDNHKASRNPLCSVGLTFDERLYPKPTDLTPDEEFQHYLDLYPAVKRQFEGAQRVREWVSTDRLQYSSKHSIGYRWCLMSHAAGFIDPLYSRGLSNTFEVVDALASRILESLQDDDWSLERYEYVDRLERGLLHYNDELVNSSYISFSHYRLFNAVFRVWASFITPGTLRLTRARLAFGLDGDDRHFKELENNPYPGLWWPDSPDLARILELTAERCEKYEVGEITGDEAADAIFEALNASPFVNPVFGWKDPETTRFIRPTPAMMAKFMWWASTQAPPELQSIGRAMVGGVARSALRGSKLL
jgi:FADH2 O2-dependent halogenase